MHVMQMNDVIRRKRRDLAEEYPSCGELLYQLATMLRGLVILRTARHEQRK